MPTDYAFETTISYSDVMWLSKSISRDRSVHHLCLERGYIAYFHGGAWMVTCDQHRAHAVKLADAAAMPGWSFNFWDLFHEVQATNAGSITVRLARKIGSNGLTGRTLECDLLNAEHDRQMTWRRNIELKHATESAPDFAKAFPPIDAGPVQELFCANLNYLIDAAEGVGACTIQTHANRIGDQALMFRTPRRLAIVMAVHRERLFGTSFQAVNDGR